MRKKINRIDKITKKILNEYLNEAIDYGEDPHRMEPSLEGDLDKDTHTFGGSAAFPSTGSDQKYSEKLASKRFKDIINMVKRYHGVESVSPQMMSEMFTIMQSVGKIEQSNKDALEQLAIDIVSEEFDVPEDMLRATLVKPLDNIDLKDEEEEEGGEEEGSEEEEEEFIPSSDKRMKELDSEISKRNVINAMMQGAAKKGHYIFHQVEKELDNIDPRLLVLYGKLMSLADLQYWLIPASLGGGAIGGKEEIKWEKPKTEEGEEESPEEDEENVKKEPVVVAKAWIFPLLVHELIKGVMELAAIGWGKGHMTPDEQKYVISKADTTANELWGLRLGPGMWEKFLECIEEEDYVIKHWLFQQLTQLNSSDFHSFMREILSSTDECKKVITHLRELFNDSEDKRNVNLEDMITGDEEDFESGLEDLLGDIGIGTAPDEETEETEEIDYSEMSKNEIQGLIDDALDAGDFDTVSKLSKYL